MKMTRINNVKISDLLSLLSKLQVDHDSVDLIVDPDNKKVIIDPVKKGTEYKGRYYRKSIKDQKLTDDNIQELI